jgi:hypothetical protein
MSSKERAVSPQREKDSLMEELETSRDVLWYRNSAPVTYESLDEMVNEVEAQVEELEIKKSEAKKLISNVKTFIRDIKGTADEYYKILLGIEHVSYVSRFHANDEREVARRSEDRDRSRRLAHDALLSNLFALTRYVNVNLRKAGIKINLEDNWFSEFQLKDRNFIGDWAYKMGKARSVIDKIEEEKKAAGDRVTQPPAG